MVRFTEFCEGEDSDEEKEEKGEVVSEICEEQIDAISEASPTKNISESANNSSVSHTFMRTHFSRCGQFDMTQFPENAVKLEEFESESYKVEKLVQESGQNASERLKSPEHVKKEETELCEDILKQKAENDPFLLTIDNWRTETPKFPSENSKRLFNMVVDTARDWSKEDLVLPESPPEIYVFISCFCLGSLQNELAKEFTKQVLSQGWVYIENNRIIKTLPG